MDTRWSAPPPPRHHEQEAATLNTRTRHRSAGLFGFRLGVASFGRRMLSQRFTTVEGAHRIGRACIRMSSSQRYGAVITGSIPDPGELRTISSFFV